MQTNSSEADATIFLGEAAPPPLIMLQAEINLVSTIDVDDELWRGIEIQDT